MTLSILLALAISADSVRVENQKPGTEAWKITNAATTEIEGYASLTSVNNNAQTIDLYVRTTDPSYTLGVYRMGWYGGTGAREIIAPVARAAVAQPACPEVSGLIQCAWTTPYTITTDTTNWTSGVYLAKLTGATSGKQAYIMFVVRDDARSSPLVFQSSVTTSQAYNAWGGKSLYVGTPEPADRVSFNRPYGLGFGAGIFLAHELDTVRFLEREGYDVTYLTNVDTHESLSRLTNHAMFLSVGHDEYWSWEMRANVEAARDAGTRIAFLSANTAYWQIRFENSNRTVVGYKEDARNNTTATDPQCRFSTANNQILAGDDPYTTDPGSDALCSGNPVTDNDCLVTTLWKCPPVNRPEDQTLGVRYNYYNGWQTIEEVGDFVFPADRSHWIYRGTSRNTGDRLPGVLGYEVDANFGGQTVVKLATNKFPNWDGTAVPVPTYSCPVACSNLTAVDTDMTIYQLSGSAFVFSFASVYWGRGLDSYSVQPDSRANVYAQQMTRNLLKEAGALPEVDVEFVNARGVSVSGNDLTKTGPNGWGTGGAASTRGLLGDGFVESPALETTTQRMFGLSNGDSDHHCNDIDYAVYLAAGVAQVYEQGTFKVDLGSYAGGDRFRVSRSGTTVRYYKNGALVYTSATTTANTLIVDTALLDTGSTLRDVVLGGDSTDVIRRVPWTNRVYTSIVTNNNLTGASPSATWSAGAASEEALRSGSGYVEITAVETNKQRMFGFNKHGDRSPNYTDIDYAIYLAGSGVLEIHEEGTWKHSYAGGYQSGDRLRVAVEGSQVVYRKNGALVYTSASAPAYPLTPDTSFVGSGGTINEAVLTGNLGPAMRPVIWTERKGPQVAGRGSLIKSSGTNGWNASARSTQEISTNSEGFVEITATENNLNRMFGLNHDRPANDTGYSAIDYAIYLASGSWEIYESGAFKIALGAYSPGDRFRVAVETIGGLKQIRYYRNGVQAAYTSAPTPTYPLFADSCFNFIGATLTDATIWSSSVY